MSRIPNSVMPHSFVPEAPARASSKHSATSRIVQIATAPAILTLGFWVIAVSSLTSLLTNKTTATGRSVN